MDTIEINHFAADLLNRWDPFNHGPGAYETEIADVIIALHDAVHPSELAKRIRLIYEQSYELWIPHEACMDISYKLIALKYGAGCPL
ncbi:DUF1871 family protein [Bhargavaea beijingensis]|uniref:DUF1871 domain-containing protein n=1 Tax=Bhargavaea beijingensis TaxID=426756 RepID=A0A1G7F034_9BACL|nr:DUF1871 family protein [Bhargavaea beijingensis]MCW1927638.1 YugE family protein [Bhargavaea beijingensis]SDE69272.1 protein of unknown function [Bhargavaea beijingensis]